MDNALVREFPPRALDKVERLLDLLGELGEHPFLKDKIALHGGTAINLFMLDAPRLSVDIDLSYVGALDRDEMLAERPIVVRSIDEVARSQGYPVFGARGGHAGRTFLLGYRSQWGPDHVKIDCIYMNRSPLMPIERRSPILRPELDVPLFTDAELAGGKVKAFFDRVKVRDLYDVANLKRGSTEEALLSAPSLTRRFSSTRRFRRRSRTGSRTVPDASPAGGASSRSSSCPCSGETRRRPHSTG